TTTVNPFVDVAETDFFYKAVLWASENGITDGVDATHFAPLTTANRAQIVTFLWRAMEKPAAEAENPFADVADDAWYHDAVIWAVENGITSGMTATAFGPDGLCNRAQMLTFLYRAYK
ncbi:MAG: S-layer homology domain-containing protein, partial [Ruminococcaceae bacterium]|nr:S-layer homology domain-containing protein [Oscillospiraceae bacterium]